MYFFRFFFLVLLISFLCFCSEDSSEDRSITFTSLPSTATGIDFRNTISENDSVNLMSNAYMYMGSGVGIGDFNKDGLPDIFLGANQGSSHLYINKGDMKFADATDEARLRTSFWVTGVSIVDINNDGYDDIYLCASGGRDAKQRRNRLYINRGNLHFTEEAAAYGLDDTMYSTQAVFFDYDRDGDIDMYLLNHLLNHEQSNDIVNRDLSGNAPARDKLYRNAGLKKDAGHPFFEDVSFVTGIIEDGYGLGVTVSDFNNDQWPDVYVANDYLANDVLWLNNKNGTFSNGISRSLKHQSYSSMGVDAGDINNDGFTDIISLDMLPEDNRRKKLMYSFLNYERYLLERKVGYDDQFMRNMLQLNNGVRTIRDTAIPFFSEIGQLSKISETDWSWSVLIVDLDNDGLKDLHITNGMGRDMINNDFISFASDYLRSGSGDRAQVIKAVNNKLNEFGIVELGNYCYRNNGNLTFTDVTKSAGTGAPSISNGCAYADLDNDGDQDLVVNNINKDALLLKNELRNGRNDNLHNFITLSLTGQELNRNGFGALIRIYVDSVVQSLEQAPARGYLSTVDKRLHVGIGKATKTDSVVIIWPDGKKQAIKNISANSIVQLNYTDALLHEDVFPANNTGEQFIERSSNLGIDFRHRETFFYDYGFQQLLPQKYSQLGPFISKGDVNGDGKTDFFVGGASNQSGKLFIQLKDGRFSSKDLTPPKPQEDLGSLFFDADGDGDQDLFINSGSIEHDPGSSNYLPRLFRNDGSGNFTHDPKALPQNIFTSAQCVSAGDFDGDGDPDLFIGGRIMPKQYPVSPESYLLQNNNGNFTIVTSALCPDLRFAGMITSAVWTDFNNDQQPDLVIAGEWMPVRFFENRNGKLNEITASTGLQEMNGQWRSLAAEDIDRDGDMDIVAGNLGMNNKYYVSANKPLYLYAKDLDGNGSIDPVPAYYIRDESGERNLYPAISRDQFAAQVPSVRKQFPYHDLYARSGMEKVLPQEQHGDVYKLVCNETRSVWLENKGDGKFEKHFLPVEAQFAPINSIICTDTDKDGYPDIIIAGNEYQAEVMTGRYDASYGLLLKGTGDKKFIPVPSRESGLIIDGDAKDIELLNTINNGRILLVAINDNNVKAFVLK